MKIFNTENGVKKVYVQKNDLRMLGESESKIPTSIYQRVPKGADDGMEFIEFSDAKELYYFKNIDWIVDYKEVRDLKEREINRKGQEVSDELNKIAERFKAMSFEEKVQNKDLVFTCNLLNYQMKALASILFIKQGLMKIPFPLVPDSDGFSFSGDSKCEYEIRSSLDPNKLLLFRKDDKTLTMDEKIKEGFYQTGMSIAVMKRSESDEFFGDYEMSNNLSEDKKYFVIEFGAKEKKIKKRY